MWLQRAAASPARRQRETIATGASRDFSPGELIADRTVHIVGLVAGVTGAVTLTLIVMLDAVLNPLWPWLLLGETPSRADFIGGSIIIGAVVISIFGGRWRNRAVP